MNKEELLVVLVAVYVVELVLCWLNYKHFSEVNERWYWKFLVFFTMLIALALPYVFAFSFPDALRDSSDFRWTLGICFAPFEISIICAKEKKK
ncbi:MAG: hypothetical protein PHS53_01375 [Candidatus Pacebacteria bacterium]|nr:hypothetical protein [Candidatus Paceibacterota bacterium]MDD5356783.1 hypothetical protein [Candidatus Paceibacterota bacterium]